MNNTHECRVDTHGKYQLEIDMSYPLTLADPGRETYFLDAYIFSPSQLGINEKSLGVENFFQRLISYTRHRTPDLSLRHVLEENCSQSPLVRLRQMFENTTDLSTLDQDAVLYELRMLVNIYAEAIGKQRQLVDEAAHTSTSPTYDVKMVVRDVLDDMENVMAACARLESLFLRPGVSEQLRESYRWADESLSLHTEKTALALYQDLYHRLIVPDLAQRARKCVETETQHRHQHGYPTLVDATQGKVNEYFIFRSHELKKWAESAMYMTTARSKMASHILQIGFGVAAAIAMMVALVASLLAMSWFPQGSISWALLLVVGYIFKDRIKELLRGAFLHIIPWLVADRVMNVRDPKTGKTIGRTRERVSYPAPENIASPIRQLRLRHNDAFRNLTRQEEIIHYHKKIKLDGKALAAGHERLRALREILRLDMRQWFEKMDKPTERLYYFDENGLRQVQANRTYHITLILGLRHKDEADADAMLRRFRIVARRNGILRIEPVASSRD